MAPVRRSRYNRGMSEPDFEDRQADGPSNGPNGMPWAAGALFLLAAGLLTAGAYGVYRQTIITGSVIGACQRLFFQGWNSVVFVALILGIPVLCVFLAISFLAPGDRH